jgi:hypothetical protein
MEATRLREKARLRERGREAGSEKNTIHGREDGSE